MKRAAASAFVFVVLLVTPATAGPLGTMQDLLTAPVAGWTKRGLLLAGLVFGALITTSVVVRLTRLGWSNHGDFGGWRSELGDMIYNIMLPGYATLFAANVFLPQIPAIVSYVSGQITGYPGVSNPDAVFLIGITTAVSIFNAAMHPLTNAPISIGGFSVPIPNFGLDVMWMTIVNLIVGLIAAIIVVLSLTRVAFEMVATTAGGLYSIALNSVAVAFSASGATKEVAGRYIVATWMIVMNIVSIVGYAVIVADIFVTVPFHAGLLNAATFIYTVFSIIALAWAVGAGASRVARFGETMYAGGSFVTAGHVVDEAGGPARAISALASKVARFRSA